MFTSHICVILGCPRIGPNKTCLLIVRGTEGDLQKEATQIPLPHSSSSAHLQDHLLEVIQGWVVVLHPVIQVVLLRGVLVEGHAK